MAWVEKRASGKWQGNYRLANGEKKSAGTYSHKAEALRQANLSEAESRKQGWIDPKLANITWGEWSESWKNARSIKKSTEVRDESRINKHILPKWKDWPLGKITKQDVKTWIAELKKTPTTDGKTLSGASIAVIYGVFSGSMTAAVDAGILSINPCRKIALPAIDQDTSRYLTKEEFIHVCQHLNMEARTIAEFLVATGARWGELVALQHKHINHQTRKIIITRSYDEASKQFSNYTKGKNKREVNLPAWLDLPTGNPNDLIFQSNGHPIDISNFRNRHWNPAVKATGIGHVRIYDLRHTFASWLLQGGIPIPAVSKMMGHKSIATTMRYSHLRDDYSQEVELAMKMPSQIRAVEKLIS